MAYLGQTLKKLEHLNINILSDLAEYNTFSDFAKKVQDKIPTLKRLNDKNIGDWIN